MDRSPSRAPAAIRPKSDSLRYASSAPGAAAWGGLPERDRALLRWLLIGDVVTSELAAVLVYGSLRTARRRLARLVELGLLRGFWAANSQRPRGRYAYALVSSARSAIERGSSHQARRREGPGTTTIHQLATNDLLAALLRSARPSEGIGLSTWLSERAVGPLFEGYLVPDALAVIGRPAARICLFIERDLGTESARTVAAKAARYAAIFSGSPHSPVNVGIVADSARRAASIHRLLGADAAPALSIWTGDMEEFVADPYGARWAGREDRRLSTLELPGELAALPDVFGARCLLDPDGADAFEPHSARHVGALRNLVGQPEALL